MALKVMLGEYMYIQWYLVGYVGEGDSNEFKTIGGASRCRRSGVGEVVAMLALYVHRLNLSPETLFLFCWHRLDAKTIFVR